MNNEYCEFNENQGSEDLTFYEELKSKFLLLLSQTINSNKSYFLKKQLMVNLYILILVVSFIFAWFLCFRFDTIAEPLYDLLCKQQKLFFCPAYCFELTPQLAIFLILLFTAEVIYIVIYVWITLDAMKSKLLRVYCEALPNFTDDYGGKLFEKTEDLYVKSRFFPYYNNRHTYDCFRGKYKNIKYLIEEVNLSRHRRKSSTVVFKGVVLTFEFPRKSNMPDYLLKKIIKEMICKPFGILTFKFKFVDNYLVIALYSWKNFFNVLNFTSGLVTKNSFIRIFNQFYSVRRLINSIVSFDESGEIS